MDDNPDIALVAALLADPARATIAWSLIDGTRRPAGELAFAANISAQSASAHLAKLVDGRLLAADTQGRHRYFRIASPEAAHMIESLASFSMSIKPKKPPAPALVRAMPPHFLQARTCYDHLAGELAVQLLQKMIDDQWLEIAGQDYELTEAGRRQLTALGVPGQPPPGSRRPFARCCVDLTQRRPHLSGTLGAALLDMYVREGWILRAPRSRVVSVTPKGRAAFARLLAPTSAGTDPRSCG
ncbi:ArsR/SmtB family transcription factor [Duganella violaceipulchra]|uniref:ArsR family transcriptional regulator n=1 Tax=Duganella violaceipulchra TaxID=2849652 RepID=A0AA41HD89_9BURK|nr:helix-turn-helix transcriptional regulator [Duganella violaceicalia]MBV6322041.1 ArsR family transcriptional regulator [Duganella violaceicalia]MCP2006961.1 DNA-binding transcriptional ArsR family regulator/DNA-binding PadR family transcriptional regulator [Duganella violaceicalia]